MPCYPKHCLAFCAVALVADTAVLGAQTLETVGSRALGMGGAFVAVATDSTATWWNPAALASGPFLDVSIARAVTEARGSYPARRDTASWFALATPPFGFSYYRLRLTDIQPYAGPPETADNPTVTESGSRQDRRAGLPVRSVAAGQIGITLVQTLIPGFHAGATLKYLRGTVYSAREDTLLAPDAALDRGDELEGGASDGAFGVDVGVIAVAGPFRAGLLARNAVEPELDSGGAIARLDRQWRVGVAYDAVKAGGPPLIVAFDADVSTTPALSGDRRNIAVGAEQWLWNERLGIRGGARFNTVGARERAATAGASVAVRAGFFLDAHAVGGGSEDDRGWGVAARVSF